MNNQEVYFAQHFRRLFIGDRVDEDYTEINEDGSIIRKGLGCNSKGMMSLGAVTVIILKST